MRLKILLSHGLIGLLLSACDYNTPQDYNPKEDYQNFLKHQEEQKRSSPSSASAVTIAEVPGKATYETYCAACHGTDGLANGAGALAMNPRPRNLSDKAWQAKVDDKHIHKVIKEGGAAVGLSATMPPWGAAISDAEIDKIVTYIRHFGK